jgi:hypothetical protein
MLSHLDRAMTLAAGIVIGISFSRTDIDPRAIPVYIVAGALIVWGRWALDKRRARKNL